MRAALSHSSCSSTHHAAWPGIRAPKQLALGKPWTLRSSRRAVQRIAPVQGAPDTKHEVVPAVSQAEAGPSPRSLQQGDHASHGSEWSAASGIWGSNVQQRTLLLSFAAAAGAGVLGSGFSLEGPWSVAEALAVLASIITIHECGHFAAARLLGIHVTKFAIGFGPSLWSYKGKEVEYSLRAIPLGGYVAFPDDDPNSGFKDDDPDLLKNRGLAERTLVISAGVIANILFALSVLFVQVNTVGKAETAYLPGVKVPEVTQTGAAVRAGIQPGDLILRVGDYQIQAASNQVLDLVSRIKASPNQQLTLTVEREGQQLAVPVTPLPNDQGQGTIGVSLLSNTYIRHIKAQGLADATELTFSEFNRLASTVANGLKGIFTNFKAVSNQLSGPVAIVAAGSEIARTDAAGLYQFCAIVNINLAAVNLLPLPALDGGYLALLALEAVRGKKLPDKLEQGVMSSGLLLLTLLGIGLVVRDTLNLL